MATMLLLLGFSHLLMHATATIQSTGDFENSKFEWAVGVSNLEFNFVYNDSYTWDYEDDRIAIIDEYECKLRANPSEFDLKCHNRGNGTFNSTLTMLNKMSSPASKCISVHIPQENDAIDERRITIKYCEMVKNSQPEKMRIMVSNNASYLDEARYECINSTMVVNGVVRKNFSIRCEFNAVWSNDSVVACWYAPTPTLIVQQNDLETEEVLNGYNVNLNCSLQNAGYPLQTEYLYKKNGDDINAIFLVDAEDHGAELTCQARNKYVKDIDELSGYSPTIVLNVSFGPLPTDYKKEEYTDIGKSYSLQINFTANPQLELSDTKLYFEGTLLNYSSLNQLEKLDDVLHRFSHSIILVDKSNFGEYTLSAASPNTNLLNRITNFTVILNSTKFEPPTGTTTSGGLSPGALIAICVAAGVVLIALAVFLIWRIRQRQERPDGTEKEERENPLYGSAPGPSHSAHKKTDKEEKANPLYQTSGGAVAVEEAYAEVKTNNKQKKKAKGTENTAFSQENIEVTYAAVNKPKGIKNAEPAPNAVYSEVDKKKKKNGPNGESDLHGLPVTDV